VVRDLGRDGERMSTVRVKVSIGAQESVEKGALDWMFVDRVSC